MKINLAVNNWIYGNAKIEDVLKRAAGAGFDGIELVGEPRIHRGGKIGRIAADYGLKVFAICGMHPGPDEGDLRALSHFDKKEKEKAVDYVKECVDLALEVGARSILIVPSLVGSPVCFKDRDEDIKNAVESIRKAAEYAEKNKIILYIEPINRYEVCLVYSVKDALDMAGKVGSPYVRIMGDTFHMQIEEGDGIPNAIRKAGGYWFQHLHAADNTREAPGLGTMPWREIIRALMDIKYEGVISCEPLPRGKAPYDARNGNIPSDRLDSELKFGVEFLHKEMEIVNRQLA